MVDALEDLRLDDYRPTELDFDCRRCDRHATASTYTLKARYGNPTLGDLARRVAADGSPPCNLAGVEGNALCTVVPIEPPVDQWAELSHALYGGWRAYLQCHRRRQALKAVKSCPGPERLDVRSLAAALGFDFKLERLAMRLQCPGCGAKAISIEWEVPPPAPPPEPMSSRPVQLRPAGETLHAPAKPMPGRGLRIVKGRAQ